jgi:hypothetical protein
MNNKQLELYCLQDVYKALEEDKITPNQAVDITCKALKMLQISFDEILQKKDVLKRIVNLELLIEKYGEIPIFFNQQKSSFSIKDIYQSND